MMIIDNKFQFGDTVYVVTDPDQKPYKVVQLRIDPGNSILYMISNVNGECPYYDFELSHEKDVLITTTN